MIQLTESLIAVEVPNDATIKELTVTENNRKQIMGTCTEKGKDVKVLVGDISLIGITPLSEEQWREVVGSYTSSETMYCDMTPYVIPVSPKDRWNDLQRHKGLDINKKYAIIKIEKK